MRICPHCGSETVCWNWAHVFSGDRKGYEEINSCMPLEELLDWVHECWTCGSCFETKDKVEDGISYEELKKRYEVSNVCSSR